MASVTAETKNGKTSYRVAWQNADKRRQRIRLTGVSKKDAQAIAAKIQAIVGCQIAQRALDTSSMFWLSQIGDDLHGKLSTAGLVEPRLKSMLGQLLDGYLAEHRTHVSERAIINLQITRDKLIAFFGASTNVRDITVDEAREWRKSLVNQPGRNGATFSEATIAGHVKRAKQLIGHAVELGCITANPFSKLKAGSQANDERKQYVPTATIQKVIDAAPDAEWRLLIALVRYAGLRNPSETLRLRWSDIAWAEGRMSVTSSKTKRQGKPGRSVPIFAALRPFLEEAYDAAEDGAKYCISRYRSQNINLRTGLERIMAKAHVPPWPRLWHNLRASAETDLVKAFPAHVAAAWLGHTPTVAVKHYLTVVDEDYQRATNWTTNQVGQGVGQSGAESTRNGSQRLHSNSQKSRGKLSFAGVGEASEYAQKDSNLRPTD